MSRVFPRRASTVRWRWLPGRAAASGVAARCAWPPRAPTWWSTTTRILRTPRRLRARRALSASAPYNACKAGINHLARTMANELARYRINVNVVEPGWIDTPGERAFATDEQLREEGKKLPWGRLGTPEEMGAVVAFLAS